MQSKKSLLHDFIPADVEGLGDRHLMLDFIVDPFHFALRAAHGEGAGRDELHLHAQRRHGPVLGLKLLHGLDVVCGRCGVACKQ